VSTWPSPDELLRRATTESERIAVEVQREFPPDVDANRYLDELARRLGAVAIGARP
jgi:hypothetical protein